MATVVEDQFATQAGHWYDASGRPAYTVIGANGKERPTTLRDARKLNLFPSVTTILKLEAAPQLERWKIEQACLACLTLPRLPGESDDAFMVRALDDSRQQAYKAADRGTYLHGLIEDAIGRGYPRDDAAATDRSIVGPVLHWLSTNFAGYQWSPERSFAHTHGFGGKIDLCGASGEFSVVIDFKCKSGIKPDKKMAYENHVTQLAAYAHGVGTPDARCINLFIDTDTPGLIVAHEWSAPERDAGWRAFGLLLDLWKCRKGVA